MKRTTAIITALLTGLLLSGCATAKAETSGNPAFAEVSDRTAHEVTLQREQAKREHAMSAYEARKAQEAEQAAQEAEQEYQEEFTAYYDGGYDDWYNNNPIYSGGYYGTMGNPDGLNSFHGTYDYNGHHETFYASYAVYDDQLWVDDDGFFRDDQGRYVVASSDYEPGAEIEMSQGTAVVMDGGCEPGTVDVHVTWGR